MGNPVFRVSRWGDRQAALYEITAISDAAAQQLFSGQQLIHRAGAETLQIERDELESQAL
jgi:hypothetical protein